MAEEVHLMIASCGSRIWNRWKLALHSKPDLSGAILRGWQLQGYDLSELDLREADLRDADLRRANLARVDLSGADLSSADLGKADLSGADLSEATLFKCDLSWADLSGTSFAGADLRSASLANSMSLETVQLKGALLGGASLPKEVSEFKALGIIKTAARHSRALLASLLLGATYTLLTIGTTTDLQLVTNSAASPLPIIGANLDVSSFFLFAPILLLSIYIYFHLGLHSIWLRIGHLPKEFPDGRRIDGVIDPWLPLSLAQADPPCGAASPRYSKMEPLCRDMVQRLKTAMSLMLVWFVVPLVLTLALWRCLRAHDLSLSFIQMLTVAASIIFGALTAAQFLATLRDRKDDEVSGSWWAARPKWVGWLSCACLLLLVIAFVFHLVFPRTANLAYAAISQRPDGWETASASARQDLLGKVTPAQLRGRDLTGVVAHNSFLVRAELSEAKIEEADLHLADLTQASGTQTSFRGTDLSSAHLIGAQFPLANFTGAELEDADATSALLDFSDFTDAELVGADLTAVKARGALFVNAMLDHANLSSANLQSSDLTGASLRGSLLKNTNLDGAELQGADFRSFVDSRYDVGYRSFVPVELEVPEDEVERLLRASDRPTARSKLEKMVRRDENPWALRPSQLQGISDLSSAIGLTQEQLETALGDCFTVLPRSQPGEPETPIQRPKHWCPG